MHYLKVDVNRCKCQFNSYSPLAGSDSKIALSHACSGSMRPLLQTCVWSERGLESKRGFVI